MASVKAAPIISPSESHYLHSDTQNDKICGNTRPLYVRIPFRVVQLLGMFSNPLTDIVGRDHTVFSGDIYLLEIKWKSIKLNAAWLFTLS